MTNAMHHTLHSNARLQFMLIINLMLLLGCIIVTNCVSHHKKHIHGRQFCGDTELQSFVKEWLHRQDKEFYRTGFRQVEK